MRTLILVALSVALSGVLADGQPGPAQASPEGGGQDKEPPVVCGFRNQAYAGLCEVRTPYIKGKQLKIICTPILDCLNDPRCVRTYCGSTTIRQGWTLESATRAR